MGAWLTVPRADAFTRGVVVGHGYGGRAEPEFNLPGTRAAAIFPCMRGQGRSTSSNIPELSAGHVLHGIESRESYVLRGCVVDIWRAASALSELVPQVERIDYMGGSFGGGRGAMELAWDRRFTKAFLSVPTFGNHPLRVTLPCNGSGEAVRLRYETDRSVLDVLQYYDAATIARRVTCPVLCECALFDPAVPPPGQFAVYNALGGPKELIVSPAGHFEHDDSTDAAAEVRRRQETWFAD